MRGGQWKSRYGVATTCGEVQGHSCVQEDSVTVSVVQRSAIVSDCWGQRDFRSWLHLRSLLHDVLKHRAGREGRHSKLGGDEGSRGVGAGGVGG